MKLLEALNIPLCQKQRIPVKTLVEQLQPTPENKKIIESHIASMYLVSLLNEQTIRIRPYKDEDYSYQAIYVFEIELKKDDSIVSLAEIVHSAFPEPTLLLLNYKSKQYISAASKRINKIDSSKTVIDDSIISEVKLFDEHLNLSNKTESSLKEYYEQILKLVYQLKTYNLTKVFPSLKLDLKPLIKEYEVINSKINKLNQDYKQASMRAEKMRIDDELYDEEMKLKLLIKRLKEGE